MRLAAQGSRAAMDGLVKVSRKGAKAQRRKDLASLRSLERLFRPALRLCVLCERIIMRAYSRAAMAGLSSRALAKAQRRKDIASLRSTLRLYTRARP